MLFLCYPKCTTCQKARKFLCDNSISFEERNIKENNPSAKELTEWLKMSGLSVRKLFNTSGILYREMGLSKKLDNMSQDECIGLLASDGMLVKRPILVTENKVLVGFKPAEWEKLI